MLVSQLINTSLPALNITDKVMYALQLMDEYDVLHLPVISADKYAGMVGKEELLSEDENSLLSSIYTLVPLTVKSEEHILTALKTVAKHHLSLLPVVNEQAELMGNLLTKDLLTALATFIGTEEKGAIIVLETNKRNFSFGELSRLVETNDAFITQLNTYTETATGLLIVTIKINSMEVSDIIATLQRYEYAVRYYFGEEEYANELRENYDHLIAYLNM
jgi:CBS domain-containing protein